jgi:hypothetical protein
MFKQPIEFTSSGQFYVISVEIHLAKERIYLDTETNSICVFKLELVTFQRARQIPKWRLDLGT